MQTGSRQLIALAATAGLGLAFAVSSTRGSAATVASLPPAFAPVAPLKTGELDRAGLRRLANARWTAYRRATGAPTISVSPAYADPEAIAQRWTSYFESLVHGPELSVLNAYVAPLVEVQRMCGSSDVLGCYGDDHLVMPDEGSKGIASTSIATHEYGHHVAFNRINPPWIDVDWGPKRWATYERVCPRAAAGTAFPGAEDANYLLNPGEAWAETYRVLNETAAGLPLTWPIVDPSFKPDAGALAAAREDVVNPWTAPTASVKNVRFSRGARTWTVQVPTPLDGKLHAQVQPGSDDVTLFAADGRTVLARGTWSTTGAKAFDAVICGQRSVVVRVTRNATARGFALRLSVP
jgi:hypothetical protein